MIAIMTATAVSPWLNSKGCSFSCNPVPHKQQNNEIEITESRWFFLYDLFISYIRMAFIAIYEEEKYEPSKEERSANKDLGADFSHFADHSPQS